VDKNELSQPSLTPAAQRAKDERDARRAAALRANLRRRKVQERGRGEDPPPADGSQPHN